MPLNARNTRTVSRNLFMGTGYFKRVTLLKRDNDQQEGTVTAFTLFYARRSRIAKTGQPIQNDMGSDHRAVWHLQSRELERLRTKGVPTAVWYINALDRIVELTDDLGRPFPDGPRWWQPESTTGIDVKLFGNEIDVACVRIDPPEPPPEEE